ncbi:MAG: patatin-like phospholipase family protein [Bacillota bacterium]
MSKKIGLCLTGGGARGAYQIGAIKALEERGILDKISAYSGTSIGSANVAVIATKGVDAAKEVWMTMPEENLPRNKKDLDKKSDKLFDFDRGIYTMDVFKSIIEKSVDLDVLKKKEVYVTLSEGGQPDKGFIDLLRCTYRHYVKHDTKVVYLPLHELESDSVIDAIVASSSIPLFFAPVKMQDKKFYDGGVFDNVPIKPLVKSGCDEIIIIHLHHHLLYNPKKVASGVTYHEIKHKGLLGHILKFSKKQTQRLYQAGYDDTHAYFDYLDKA